MSPEEFKRTAARITEIYGRPLFFVIGPPKSGTTWLQLMLDGHPEIHCAGEGHFTDWIGEPLKELLADYNKNLKFNNQFIYREDRYYSGFTHADYRYLIACIICMALCHQKIGPDVKWIGDKTPIYTYNLAFLHEIFPEARFVGILRDPRDAAVSIIQQRFRLGDDPNFKVGSADYKAFVSAFAEKWVTVSRQMRSFAETHQNLYAGLRYEDLHADPAALLPALKLLSVESSVTAIEACASAGDFKQHAQGRERGQTDSRSFFRKGIVGDWSDNLDHESLAILEDIAGSEMRLRGYGQS